MCRREHPVVDGIPILLADVRGFVAGQLSEIRARDDLDPITESLLGDCAGPGSELERHRYQVSSYARGHYGDLDPERPAGREGDLVSLLAAGLELLSEPPSGLWLDLGCAAGRSAFELAARTNEPVLGVDLSFPLLRVAMRAATEGRIVHPLRRAGLCYERRDFAAELPGRDLVDFWICNAAALPLPDGAAAGAIALNLLDCTVSPLAFLKEAGRVLDGGAEALFATPYDWSAGATPIEGWIGGHSHRGEGQGDPAGELARLLAPGDPAEAGLGLEMVRERDGLPWQVYVHERASMRYSVHLTVARAAG